MTEVTNTLHIRIQYFSGREDEEDAPKPYYVAACDEIVAVTTAPTWATLMQNIHEMVEAALDGEDTEALYRIAAHPPCGDHNGTTRKLCPDCVG